MFTVFMVSRLRCRFVQFAFLGAGALLTVACQKVPLLAPTGSTITLTASATALPTGGSTQIIAQVIEAAGTPPHEGTHVTFTTSLGSIEPSEAETDISGRAIVRFNAGTSSGTATITALSGGVSVATANQVKIQIGAAAVGSISIAATPTTLPSGGGTATLTATVADSSGNALANVPVVFAIDTSTNGTAGGTGSLSQSVVNTDTNGRATTSLTTTRTTTISASAGIATTSGTTTTAAQISRVTITVNQTNSISIGAPTPATPIAGQAVTFPLTYGTSTTASPVVRLTVDWGDGSAPQSFTGQPAAISHTFRSQGSFLVVVTGVDAVGDTTTTTSAVTVNARPALAVTISANPSQPAINQVVTFTITATPSTGNAITSVAIDFGDGTRGTVSGNVSTVEHVYTPTSPTAQYVVTVVATDSAGNTGSASTVIVVGNFSAPTAGFSVSPTTGPTSTVFQFNAADSTGSIVNYSWDFGDSGTGSGSAVTHTYGAAGTYTVRLTVTDTSGRTATTTKTVTVT